MINNEKKYWSEKDLKYLIEKFPIFGSEYCAKYFNCDPKQVQTKAQKLGIIFIGHNKYSSENLTKIVKNSKNFSDVVRKLNLIPNRGNRKTVQKYIDMHNIDISHFVFFEGGGTKNTNNIPLSEILIENSTYCNLTQLKKKLYKQNLKKPFCEMCGQGEVWMGKNISMILDHINGNNRDNRLENLQILCPNCSATLDTHCSKNLKNKYNLSEFKKQIKNYFCKCGKQISKKSKHCSECYIKIRNNRLIPNLKQLKIDVQNLGYCGTGRKYGVSDNCIRKWIKKQASVG